MKKQELFIEDDNTFKLNYLDPKKVKFFKKGDALRVTIEGDKSCLRVIPMKAFPISISDQYISLRDIKGEELGIIKDPKELDKESQKLLEDEIKKRYFRPIVKKVKSIRSKIGIVEWEFETDRGKKKILTRSIHESIEEINNGFIVKDLDNNQYEICLSRLDPASIKLINDKI